MLESTEAMAVSAGCAGRETRFQPGERAAPPRFAQEAHLRNRPILLLLAPEGLGSMTITKVFPLLPMAPENWGVAPVRENPLKLPSGATGPLKDWAP